MSQTTTCLCILAFVTAVGCAEEPATILPDGGRIGAGDSGVARDAGGSNPAGKLDAGMDAGRDAGSTDDEDDEGDEPTDDDDSQAADAGTRASAFALSSPDFTERGVLPEAHTCGNAVSPALSWTPGPEGTQSYAIQLRDTEADTPLRSYWLLYDLPADITELQPMIPRRATVQNPPARQALDDSRLGTYGYYGPCTTATLELSVHALDVAQLPDIAADAGAAAISAAISEHELEKATMMVRSMGPDESAP